jgi:dTDP-4-amino-4,6-dideoxygalactose transaminase
LSKLDGWVQQRRSNARVLTQELAGIAGLQTPVESSQAESSFNLYSILIDPSGFGCDRDELAVRLAAQDVGSAVHYPRCLHQQPVYASKAWQPLPVAELLSKRILSIPVDPSLGLEEIRSVATAVRQAGKHALTTS